MGCDIHIAIERQNDDGTWSEIVWQRTPYTFDGERPAVDDIPMAPEVFSDRNYDLFGILANVRNGRGFAGIQMGEGWPSIAPERGWPEGFDPESVAPDPQYSDDGESRYMGDHSFTWVSLDELKAFDWDTTESWLYGCVTPEVYEVCTERHVAPVSYSGDVSGPGIVVYEPDAYKEALKNRTIAHRPYIRMGWPETARQATNDWPGQVLPWLESLANGRPLRLCLGFDS